jgi:hypothetical protein
MSQCPNINSLKAEGFQPMVYLTDVHIATLLK